MWISSIFPWRWSGIIRPNNECWLRIRRTVLVRYPVDTWRKLNKHKTFRRHPRRLPNVLCTFNLRPVSTWLFNLCILKMIKIRLPKLCYIISHKRWKIFYKTFKILENILRKHSRTKLFNGLWWRFLYDHLMKHI